MSYAQLAAAAVDAIGPLQQWAMRCHAASLALVQSGVLGPSRVARGACVGVPGQHSWVVLGNDCYDEGATIVDPTLWSYDLTIQGVWVGTTKLAHKHTPHGKGSIWEWGRPDPAEPGKELKLTPAKPWSSFAESFLDLLGPVDKKGWIQLAHAPVEGWPAGEILAAMVNTDENFLAYIPIDILGMTTDLNPKGLYLP